jgi:hypothetical protein
MRSAAVAILVLVNAALAAALGWLWLDEGRARWVEPAAVAPALDEIAVPSPAPLAEVSRYRETVERPLFVASRRPGAAKPAEAKGDADPLHDLRLLGLYGSGSRGGAIVVQGGKTQRVRFGEKIGPWTIVSADGRSATLVRDQDRRSLAMALINEAPAMPKPAQAARARAAAEEPDEDAQEEAAQAAARSAHAAAAAAAAAGQGVPPAQMPAARVGIGPGPSLGPAPADGQPRVRRRPRAE